MAKRELANRRLLPFVKYNFPEYDANWHHELLIQKLEEIERGELKRLIVMMPPRHGKSELCSIQFPSWYLGNNPTKSIITASYSAELASDFGRQTRDLVQSTEFSNVFDKTSLKADTKAKSKWNIKSKGNREGSYFAVGVGGSVTGRGADVLLIDDPIKNRQDADSETIRDNIWNWYRSTARTRLSPEGAVVIILTRWHEDDIVGRILEGETSEKWEIIKFKAIAEEDSEYRDKGEVLWDKYDKDNLNETKAEIGPYEWSALYQQEPVDEESQEFKQDWFKSISWDDIKDQDVRKFATIDPALSKRDENDKTGVVRNYVNKENNWHLKAERHQIDSKDIIDIIFNLHDEGFEKIGIEQGQYAEAIMPYLEEESRKRGKFPNVEELKHRKSAKETRIRGLVPRYKQGKIYHIEGYCDDLEHEAIRFPKAKYDDVLDATAYQTDIAQPPEPEPSEEFGLYSKQKYN